MLVLSLLDFLALQENRVLPLILTLSHPVSSAAIGWCCLTYPMWIPVVCIVVLAGSVYLWSLGEVEAGEAVKVAK